jgi:V/A-type H+-transporting ATPase subunit C
MKTIYSCENVGKDTRSVYIVGKIKAREALLFDAATYEKMIGIRTARELIDFALNTKAYQAKAARVKSPHDIDTFVRGALQELRTLCRDFLSGNELLFLLFLKYDAHNLKVVFKEEVLKRDLSHLYLECGNVNVHSLKAAAKGPSRDAHIARLAQKTRSCYAKTHSLLAYALCMDKEVLETLYTEFSARHLDFLRDYARMYIDYYNTMLFLRRAPLFKNDATLARVLTDVVAEGGFIEKAFFMRACAQDDIEGVKKKLLRHYPGLIADVRHCDHASGSLWKVEIDFLRYLITYIAQTRYLSFGFEPIFGFGVLQEQELNNIRFLVTAKQNALDENTIRERLVYA